MERRALPISLLLAICAVGIVLVAWPRGEPAGANLAGLRGQKTLGPAVERLASTTPGSSRAAVSREPLALQMDVDSSTEPVAQGDTPAAGGIALHGSVRWSGEGTPVPRLQLLLNGAGGLSHVVVSDEAGRFETGPILGDGSVRLRLTGDGRRPGGLGRLPDGLRLEREMFIVPEGAAAFEVELLLRRPSQCINVEVRDGRDAPVDGAEVTLEALTSTGEGSRRHDVWRQSTDGGGRASFALYEPDRIDLLGLFAELRAGEGPGPVLTSERRMLELPLPLDRDTMERLVLYDGASVLVRAVDEEGTPIAGRWISVEVANEPLFAWLPGGGTTNANGELRIDGLPAGAYTLAADAGSTEVRQQIELLRGVQHEMELTLPGAAPRLAVAGVVLDETGAPLPRASVTVVFGPRDGPGEDRAWRRTDEHGRFEFRATPCDGLTVLLDGYLGGDEFAPRSIAAAFGDQNLEFRRTKRIPRHLLDLEIVDATTEERVQQVFVMTVRPPGTPDYELRSASEGILTIGVSEHPDVRFLIEAPGYRRLTLAPRELPLARGPGSVHRVALERGLLLRIEVQGEPAEGAVPSALAGAVVREGTRRLGVTDSEGGLTLDLHHWPAQPLRFEAPGHRPVEWSPVDGLGEPGPAVIRMQPNR